MLMNLGVGMARCSRIGRRSHRDLHDLVPASIQHRLPPDLNTPYEIHSYIMRDWFGVRIVRHA